ncbi:TPA: protein LvrA [Legionella pneumophila]
MSFLFANAHELAALLELPYIQRLVYLMGIRPYMDRQSCIVGIKRRISYQSLRETLYVGPIAGVKTENPRVGSSILPLATIRINELRKNQKNSNFPCRRNVDMFS